jgi:hypothetical protein
MVQPFIWRKRQFQQSQKTPTVHCLLLGIYIDQQTYETSAVFGPETWLRMKTPADHTWERIPSGTTNTFGLSPGGKVNIWFPDVAGRPSLPSNH